MTSIKRQVGQSTTSGISERRVNECRSSMYEPRRSRIGLSKENVGEWKYVSSDDSDN